MILLCYCGTLMDPTSLVKVLSLNVTNELALIDEFETRIRSPMHVLCWMINECSIIEVVLINFVG